METGRADDLLHRRCIKILLLLSLRVNGMICLLRNSLGGGGEQDAAIKSFVKSRL